MPGRWDACLIVGSPLLLAAIAVLLSKLCDWQARYLPTNRKKGRGP